MSDPRETIVDALAMGFDLHEDAADNILAAFSKAGIVLLPAEPTEALLNALYGSYWDQNSYTIEDCKRAYRQMIAAAGKE